MFVKYDELRVYKLAYSSALDIHHQSLQFPKIEQYGGLADQLRCSSKSICANIAEGLEKLSSRDEEKRFLSIARGSCAEVIIWLKFCRDLKYLSAESSAQFIQNYDDISKMIYAMIQKRKKNS
ncbi:MAG: four helix bundle protein [Proteobacteria bacterium]|nr:four helix bundle protein [Pseudomonadota bacterium]